MKSHTKYLTLHIPERMGFVNITPQVQEAVRTAGVKEGLCLVNAMHITASVFINDDEPGLHEDYARLSRSGSAAARVCADRCNRGPLLRRVRRAPRQADPDQDHRRMRP